VFDLDDLKARTAELADFLAKSRKAYALERPVAVGFSNGANIAWSLLLSHPDALAGAILMRAMLPFEPQNIPDLAGKPVLILSGAVDPLVSAAQRDRLAELLKRGGADVRYEVLPAGHQLTRQDLALAADWLAKR
jgi:phospholipase/carboxylesterase